MASFENLTDEKAIEKLKELAEGARTCMFCTDLNERPIPSRPMALESVDKNGNLWFLSSQESVKNAEIMKDHEVQLFFSHHSASEYLSVYGRAKIYKDKSTIEERWAAMANTWFEGKEDPNLTAICVTPQDVKYWDTKNGKMITLMKLASAALTGKRKDEGGVEGKLEI